eukprot:13371779-Alexandrium_andersonii.AAC.1
MATTFKRHSGGRHGDADARVAPPSGPERPQPSGGGWPRIRLLAGGCDDAWRRGPRASPSDSRDRGPR